jgi:hypothetical protein
MVAILVAIVVAVAAVWAIWLLDVRITGNRISSRLIAALVLLATSTWMSTIILAEPYDLNEANAFFWGHMRVVCVFVTFGCVILAAAASMYTVVAFWWEARSVPMWRLCVVPALSLVSLAITLYLIDLRAFLPSV